MHKRGIHMRNVINTIEVYSELEVMVGQLIYEQRYKSQGGMWYAVADNHKHIWYDMAREIITLVNDYEGSFNSES